MANELKPETIRRALDARLSPLSASPGRRARIRAAAARKEKRLGKRRGMSFALTVALLLALAGAALALGTSLFARFAQNDERYAGVLDQVTEVTEKPETVQDETLGTVSARVDSAYYDGQSLTLTIAVENARSLSEWTPTAEEQALMTADDDLSFPVPAAEEERRILSAYQEAKAAGRPFGLKSDTLWVHDHFYTDDGISLPPYYGDEEEENGTIYEIREFTPLPEEVCGRDILSVHAELGRSTVYYYFDGQREYWRSDVQREGVGRVTATVPKADAEIALFTGRGTLNGAACTVTAQVSAMELRLTIEAEADVFPLEKHQEDGFEWTEQPWLAAVFDETGTEYPVRESSSAESARRLTLSYDGTGHVPERLTVYVYRCAMDEDVPDEAAIRSGSFVELTR